ncbi:hypothetical protein LXL04_005852 [Taraxacum kok-saghyz]
MLDKYHEAIMSAVRIVGETNDVAEKEAKILFVVPYRTSPVGVEGMSTEVSSLGLLLRRVVHDCASTIWGNIETSLTVSSLYLGILVIHIVDQPYLPPYHQLYVLQCSTTLNPKPIVTTITAETPSDLRRLITCRLLHRVSGMGLSSSLPTAIKETQNSRRTSDYNP